MAGFFEGLQQGLGDAPEQAFARIRAQRAAAQPVSDYEQAFLESMMRVQRGEADPTEEATRLKLMQAGGGIDVHGQLSTADKTAGRATMGAMDAYGAVRGNLTGAADLANTPVPQTQMGGAGLGGMPPQAQLPALTGGLGSTGIVEPAAGAPSQSQAVVPQRMQTTMPAQTPSRKKNMSRGDADRLSTLLGKMPNVLSAQAKGSAKESSEATKLYGKIFTAVLKAKSDHELNGDKTALAREKFRALIKAGDDKKLDAEYELMVKDAGNERDSIMRALGAGLIDRDFAEQALFVIKNYIENLKATHNYSKEQIAKQAQGMGAVSTPATPGTTTSGRLVDPEAKSRQIKILEQRVRDATTPASRLQAQKQLDAAKAEGSEMPGNPPSVPVGTPVEAPADPVSRLGAVFERLATEKSE